MLQIIIFTSWVRYSSARYFLFVFFLYWSVAAVIVSRNYEFLEIIGGPMNPHVR